MAVNTILLDFSVDPNQVKNETQVSTLMNRVENIVRDFLTNVKPVNSFLLEGSSVKVLMSDRGTMTTLRIFSHGLLTINIEYYRAEAQEPVISFEHSKQLEAGVRAALTSFRSKLFPPIKRGAKLDVYLSSSAMSTTGRTTHFEFPIHNTEPGVGANLPWVDEVSKIVRYVCFNPLQTYASFNSQADERLLEYDIDKTVFEERSPFQKVQIVHSKSLGNMLVLDDLQNISEADLIYTETLMQRGKENYKDKDIVILGGGDGALLYELLKESPRQVLMLEIDETVMRACNDHLRSICGDVLEKRSGPNYQIITGDCTKSLNMFIDEGRKFDYVFGDLTDIPISVTPTGEMWDFIVKILQLSFKILKPSGKYMTHANGVSCPESLKMYESQLKKLNPPVVYKKTAAFVPSFLEDWVFYQVTFADKS